MLRSPGWVTSSQRRVAAASGSARWIQRRRLGRVDRPLTRRELRRLAVVDGVALAGIIVLAWMILVESDRPWLVFGVDALVYWGVDLSAPYAGSMVGDLGAYLYSPAFAQAFAPFRLLPPEWFAITWSVLLAVIAGWLARPLPIVIAMLAFPLTQEVLVGNIHVLLGLAIVLGFRWPAAWAFVVLTKVTPAVGLTWFAVRREWRSLGIAVGATVVIVAVSFAIAPVTWSDWFAFLRREGGGTWPSLAIRLAAAVCLVAWGARTDRRWTVPVGALLSLPVIWSDSFAILLACAALIGQRGAGLGQGSERPEWLTELSVSAQPHWVMEPAVAGDTGAVVSDG